MAVVSESSSLNSMVAASKEEASLHSSSVI